jgi:hypothetical protein
MALLVNDNPTQLNALHLFLTFEVGTKENA